MGTGMFQSVATFVTALNKHVSRTSKKIVNSHHNPTTSDRKFPPPSPTRSPKASTRPQLSRKVSFIPFLSKKKSSTSASESDEDEEEQELEKDECVWRKTILMGEKCEPLDFSGVIYYDNNGKPLDHIPLRSPRHPSSSPLPGFSFPVLVATEKDDKGGDE